RRQRWRTKRKSKTPLCFSGTVTPSRCVGVSRMGPESQTRILTHPGPSPSPSPLPWTEPAVGRCPLPVVRCPSPPQRTTENGKQTTGFAASRAGAGARAGELRPCPTGSNMEYCRRMMPTVVETASPPGGPVLDTLGPLLLDGAWGLQARDYLGRARQLLFAEHRAGAT